jgi:hypothetical protein
MLRLLCGVISAVTEFIVRVLQLTVLLGIAMMLGLKR